MYAKMIISWKYTMADIEFFDNFTVIDIETTGLNPIKDNIIELSAIRVRENIAVSTFSKLVNPQRELHPFISKLTGINNTMLSQAKLVNEVLPEFLEFVGDDVILGHNIRFDISFINQKSLTILNRPFINKNTDTLKLSRKLKIQSQNHKLKTLADFYRITQGRMHRGLEDCRITLEVYKHLRQEAIEKNLKFV